MHSLFFDVILYFGSHLPKSSSLLRWMIKYKVVHVLSWIIISFFLLGIDYDPSAPLLPQLLGTMVATGLSLPACYIAAYRLIPFYLYKKKVKKFIALLLLLVIGNTAISYLITLFIYHLMTGLPMFRSAQYVIYIGSVIFYYNVMLISISCAIKIIADRFNIEQRLLEVEKERISTELNFLRSQVNPHFLFNVMNTIYFQIAKENVPARASIEKLSEMLRYQLYECTSDTIDISKEIDYIKNYVAMQSLRMEKGTDIQLIIGDNVSGFFIAPLLLLPIIENAFKHISNFKKPADNKIYISIKNENNAYFSVNVINTFDRSVNTTHLVNSGGLGMQNLQRRLQLLYPQHHDFTIDKKEDVYETTLKIWYND